MIARIDGETARRAGRDLGAECRSPGERDGKHRAGDHRRQQRPERDPIGDAGAIDRADELGSQSLPGAVEGDRSERDDERNTGDRQRRGAGHAAQTPKLAAGDRLRERRTHLGPFHEDDRSPSAVRKTSSSEEAACRARNAPGSPRSSTTPRWRRTIS